MSISKIFECYFVSKDKECKKCQVFQSYDSKVLNELSTWIENLLDEVIFENSAERGDRESVDYLLHIWKQK